MGRRSHKIRKHLSCSALTDKIHFVHGRQFFGKTNVRAPFKKYESRSTPELYTHQLENTKENRLYRTLPKYSTYSGNRLKCRKNPSLRALVRSQIVHINLLKKAYGVAGKSFDGINTHEFNSSISKIKQKFLRPDEVEKLPVRQVTTSDFFKNESLYDPNMAGRLSNMFLSYPGVQIVDELSPQEPLNEGKIRFKDETLRGSIETGVPPRGYEDVPSSTQATTQPISKKTKSPHPVLIDEDDFFY